MLMQSAYTELEAGARNLLLNCAQAQAGERVLIAYEPETFGYFDSILREVVSECARDIGMSPMMVDVGFHPNPSGLPEAVLRWLSEVDIVLFLARLGDQLRFSQLPDGPRYVVCFAQDRAMLGSPFGTASYAAFCEIKAAVDMAIMAAEQVTITCPAGTHVTGHVPLYVTEARDTTSKRFPMSIFSPVRADAFSGRVALGRFLTGTGVTYYDGYTVEFDAPVHAILNQGRLAGFEGCPPDVAKANAHYDYVANRFSLDRDAVHSWHAGIHPGCGFPLQMRTAFEKWGGAAFGNPRILHFHTCGAEPPGEISWNVFDPTITIEDVACWTDGTFHIDRLPEGRCILDRHPDVAWSFANPDLNVGL